MGDKILFSVRRAGCAKWYDNRKLHDDKYIRKYNDWENNQADKCR